MNPLVPSSPLQERGACAPRKKKLLFLMSGMIMGGIEKVLLSYMEELRASGRYDCGVVNFTPVTDPFF